MGAGVPGGPQASSMSCRVSDEVGVALCHLTSLGPQLREGEAVVPAHSCRKARRLGAHQVCAQRSQGSAHTRPGFASTAVAAFLLRQPLL